MTAKLHPNTTKKAAKFGIAMTVETVGDAELVVARDAETEHELSSGAKGTEVLADALQQKQHEIAEQGGEFVAEHGTDPDADETSAEADVDAEEDEAENRGNIVPPVYRERYGQEQNCGDPIAVAVSGAVMTAGPKGKKGGQKMVMDHQALLNLGADNGVDVLERWGSRNPGMWRMNLANVFRGKIAKGESVEIDGVLFDLNGMPNTDRWNRARMALEAKIAKKNKIPGFVDGVKAHAIAHYDEDGWDIIVETKTDEELTEMLKKAKSLEDAINIAKEHATLLNEQRLNQQG